MSQALLQRRTGFAPCAEQRRNLAQFGLHAACDHHAARAAINGDGALVDHIAAVAQRRLGVIQGTDVLFRRHRLARQRRFLHSEHGAFNQPQIGRDQAAGLDQHDVTRHQLVCHDFNNHSIAQYAGGGRGKFFQRRHGALGTVFLDKADNGIEQHDHQDGNGVDGFADESGDHRGTQQHQDHEIGELAEEHMPRTAAHGFADLIRSEAAQSLRRFGCAQPCGAGSYAESLQHGIGGRQ